MTSAHESRNRPSLRRTGHGLLGVGLLVATHAGCDTYDEGLLAKGSGASGGAAGTASGGTGGGSAATGGTGATLPDAGNVPENQWGSGVGWWSEDTGGCIRAGLPTAAFRPPPSTDPDIDALWFAIDRMALGSLDRDQQPTEGAWESLGFDLDGVCTKSSTCTGENGGSCKSQQPDVHDGKQCRDNTFGRLEATAVAIPAISETYGLSNDGFNCAMCNGDYNMLFRISGYNGLPDDDVVRIDVYPSPGTVTQPSWACQAHDPNHDWRTKGCWTTDDRWTFQEGTVASGIGQDGIVNSKLYDAAAYVRQGFIVAQLPADALFWFPGDNGVTRAFPLKLQGGVVAGKMVKENGAWRITDATIAGRSTKDDMIGGFRLLGFCEQDANYQLMTTLVGTYADIIANGAVSPSADCDALSVGIGFEARQAVVTGSTVAVTPLPGCPPLPDGGAGTGGTAGAGGAGGAGGAAGTADASTDAPADVSATGGTAGSAGSSPSAGTGG